MSWQKSCLEMKIMNVQRHKHWQHYRKKFLFMFWVSLKIFDIKKKNILFVHIKLSIRFHLQWIVNLPPIYYTTNKCSFLFFCRGGPRWNKVQDSLSMWERRVAHFVWYWGIHLSDTSQLWPVFHCHLQQTRLHRLERQLYVAPNHKSTANKVRTTFICEFWLD